MSQDRTDGVVLEALKSALSRPGEQRLYRSGKLEGLFPGKTGVGGEAAARALREGLVEITRVETKGKTSHEWARLTPRGVDWLHEHESPVRTLRELLGVLRQNQSALPVWLDQFERSWQEHGERLTAQVRQWEEKLSALCQRAEQALLRIEQSLPVVPDDLARQVPWGTDALRYLDRRRDGGAAEPCPLPELFAALQGGHGELSLQGYHDGLRQLQERQFLQLTPAPADAELAQPEFALFDGGRLLYAAER